MRHLITNVIEVSQEDGSVKVVLGSIVESTAPRLSRRMLANDKNVLVRLAETYSAPALMEFLGRHMIGIAEQGRKLSQDTPEAAAYFRVFDRAGLAMIGASIAIEAVARTSEAIQAPVSEEEVSESEQALTFAELLAQTRLLERDINRKH